MIELNEFYMRPDVMLNFFIENTNYVIEQLRYVAILIYSLVAAAIFYFLVQCFLIIWRGFRFSKSSLIVIDFVWVLFAVIGVSSTLFVGTFLKYDEGIYRSYLDDLKSLYKKSYLSQIDVGKACFKEKDGRIEITLSQKSKYCGKIFEFIAYESKNVAENWSALSEEEYEHLILSDRIVQIEIPEKVYYSDSDSLEIFEKISSVTRKFSPAYEYKIDEYFDLVENFPDDEAFTSRQEKKRFMKLAVLLNEGAVHRGSVTIALKNAKEKYLSISMQNVYAIGAIPAVIFLLFLAGIFRLLKSVQEICDLKMKT